MLNSPRQESKASTRLHQPSGCPMKRTRRKSCARGRLAHLGPPDWRCGSRDVPSVMQLEEGVDVVNQHEGAAGGSSQSDLGAHFVPRDTHARNAVRGQSALTNHDTLGCAWLQQWPHGPVKRRDASLAGKRKMPAFFKVAILAQAALIFPCNIFHSVVVGGCWLRQWPHGPVKRRDTSLARRRMVSSFFGESPKTHKWVQAAALPRKGVTYPNRGLRKSSRTDCLSQVTSGGGDALAAKKSHNIEVAAEQRTGGDSQANRFGIHTLREVKATIRTLKKLVQLFHSSVNFGRGEGRQAKQHGNCQMSKPLT